MSWSPLIQGINAEFMYIHPPKTSGRWVCRMLVNNNICKALKVSGYPEGHPLESHVDWREFGDRPGLRLSTIRDPWSWYRSMVSYHLGRNGFDNFLKAFRDAAKSEDPLKLVRAMVEPVKYGVRSGDGAVVPLEMITGEGMSLYSYVFRTVTGLRPDMTAMVDAFMDSTRINQSIVDGLMFVGCHGKKGFAEGPVGASKKIKDWEWDRRLIDKIEEKESWITQPFGYRYGHGAPFRMWRCVRRDTSMLMNEDNLEIIEGVLKRIMDGKAKDTEAEAKNALGLLKLMKPGGGK